MVTILILILIIRIHQKASDFLMYSQDSGVSNGLGKGNSNNSSRNKNRNKNMNMNIPRNKNDPNEIARNIARNSSYSSNNDFVGLTLSGQTTPTVFESESEYEEDSSEENMGLEIPYGELQSGEQIQMLLEEIQYLKEQNKLLLERR